MLRGSPKPQVNCYGACAGATQSKAPGLGNGCSGELAFPEGAPGFSGFGKTVWPWSVVDKVKIPATLPAGDYLLSWRWDVSAFSLPAAPPLLGSVCGYVCR
jgi:hypothetical protein